MSKKSEDYEDGKQCAYQYFNSQAFASLTRDIDGEHAIKLFKSPVKESLMMVASPMLKDRIDWIKGFNDWKKQHLQIIAEQSHLLGCLCESCMYDKEGRN